MVKNIFITGVSGCVGHYIFAALCRDPEYHLYLLVRDPRRLRFDPAKFPNVTIIRDELKNAPKYADILKETDYLIHLAAGWGVIDINYDQAVNLMNLLSPERVKKVIYFSTTSILGPGNAISEEAGKCGTPYIQGKYLFYKNIPKLAVGDRVITLFPTWVLGGDKDHPYSHAYSAIPGMLKWLWLIRFFSLDASFHFIHAHDIARITVYLLKHETKERDLVLGNDLVTADEFIDAVCRYFGKRTYFKFKITPELVRRLATLLRKKLTAWDNFVLEHRHAEYRTVNCKSFGLSSKYGTVTDILRDISNISQRSAPTLRRGD